MHILLFPLFGNIRGLLALVQFLQAQQQQIVGILNQLNTIQAQARYGYILSADCAASPHPLHVKFNHLPLDMTDLSGKLLLLLEMIYSLVCCSCKMQRLNYDPRTTISCSSSRHTTAPSPDRLSWVVGCGREG